VTFVVGDVCGAVVMYKLFAYKLGLQGIISGYTSMLLQSSLLLCINHPYRGNPKILWIAKHCIKRSNFVVFRMHAHLVFEMRPLCMFGGPFNAQSSP